MFHRVHRYLERVTPQRPAVMREMETYAKERGFPIVGPLVGRFLYQMALLTKARNILELGSGFGYSAYWFSLALRGRGRIIMTDGDKSNRQLALGFFKQAGLESQFEYRVGDALKIIKKYDGPFDIVFNDIDKEGYPQTLDLVAPRLRKGGLFITDNLIWSGRVCDKDPDGTTKAIQNFTRALYGDSRFFTTIMPLRDGVSVGLRV